MTSRKRFSDEAIREAYEATGNVWRAGELIGCGGQTISRRLAAMGVETIHNKPYRTEEMEAVRKFYIRHVCTPRDEINLEAFARKLGRPKATVCKIARQMGLTNLGRSRSQEAALRQGEKVKAWQKANGHPRGMAGKKHSEETRARRGAAAKECWANVTEEQLEQRYQKQIASRKANGGVGFPNNPGGGGYAKCKRGHREDLGLYFRSAWEANWARYLNFLVANPNHPLQRWEYEPDRFWFEPIRSGCTSYLPDFKVFEEHAEPYYHEVKGRMDQKSRTKLKRMARYHPDVRVDIIDAKAYREVEKKLAPAIPGWEFPES